MSANEHTMQTVHMDAGETITPTRDDVAMPRLKPRRATSRRVSAGELLAENALLVTIVTLALFGVVMIASASLPFAERSPWYTSPFHFVFPQIFFLGIGLAIGYYVYQIPVAVWERVGPYIMMASLVALVFVLVPGIGKSVNGARRWIDVGVFTIQVSEVAKLCFIVYLAGYLVRREALVQNTWGGFLRPLLLICLASALLLGEPDFGAAFVIVATSLMMLFVARVRLDQLAVLSIAFGVVAAISIVVSPYRLQRVTGFLEPFADVYNTGFQLAQSLIAIGSGGLAGVGFGSSVQKNFYLPEAHTDFLFAVIAEELGLVGVVVVVLLYGFLLWRCFRIARDAERAGFPFASYLALGVGCWIGLQAFVNMGVSLGILPTKGITLPLMSYGGSSVVIFAVALALLLRVESEVRERMAPQTRVVDESTEPENMAERRRREAARELVDSADESGFDEALWQTIRQRLDGGAR